MRLAEIIERLSLDVLTLSLDAEVEVTGGYCGDLLSHALASAAPGDLWITIQHHANVVAVAQVVGLSAVLMTDGKRPDEASLERAQAAGIRLLGSSESSFEISGRLHRLLADER
jgi:hypothetical protein